MNILFVLDYNTFGSSYIDTAIKAAPYAEKIWLRIKDEPDREIYGKACALRKALPDAFLILSGRADIAVCAHFNGVHLNKRSIPAEAVKSNFPGLTVGYSAHSPDECGLNADYFTLSPVFGTKKDYPVSPIGPITAPKPNVYALGGINLDNAALLLGKGYRGAAGISLISVIAEIYKILRR